jgi:hypothetical protein
MCFRQDENSVDLKEKESITEEAGRALAQYPRTLGLNGLTELSAAAAKALAQYRGNLVFNGLAELSGTFREALAQHNNKWGKLILDGLTELFDSATHAFARSMLVNAVSTGALGGDSGSCNSLAIGDKW